MAFIETVLVVGSPAGLMEYGIGFTLWLGMVGTLCLSAIGVLLPVLWSKKTGFGTAVRPRIRRFSRPVAPLHAS